MPPFLTPVWAQRHLLVHKAAPSPARAPAAAAQLTLFGTGSDRLPWATWLPRAGKLATSWAAPALPWGASLRDSFSFRTLILEGLAGFSFVG